MFIERKSLKTQLNAYYENKNASLAVMTGSFGMGKTTLLREFAKEIEDVFFFEAYETTGLQQLSLIKDAWGLTKEKNIEEVFSTIAKKAKSKKILVIIDNYPYFAKASQEFDKVLFDFYKALEGKGKLKLILCGDEQMLMDKLIFGKKSNWASEEKALIKVGPYSFAEVKDEFKTKSSEEKLFLYGITGGIPYNVARVNGVSREAVKELYLGDQKRGLCPGDVMKLQLREASYYNHMLSELATGKNRVNQISEAVDKPKDIVVPYLNTLMDMELVTKETAITEKTNRKKTRYSILNTATLFWYKYIVPNMNKINEGKFQEVLDIIDDQKEDFLHTSFVNVCEQYLKRQSEIDGLPFTVDEIGNWWINDEENGTSEGFDLVALGLHEGKNAVIYSRCNCGEGVVEVSEIKQLIELSKKMKSEGEQFFIVFSKNGFHENAITISKTVKNILLISLDEICK